MVNTVTRGFHNKLTQWEIGGAGSEAGRSALCWVWDLEPFDYATRLQTLQTRVYGSYLATKKPLAIPIDWAP